MSRRLYYTTEGPASTDAIPAYAMVGVGETTVDAVQRSIGRALGMTVITCTHDHATMDGDDAVSHTYRMSVGRPAIGGGWCVAEIWAYIPVSA